MARPATYGHLCCLPGPNVGVSQRYVRKNNVGRHRPRHTSSSSRQRGSVGEVRCGRGRRLPDWLDNDALVSGNRRRRSAPEGDRQERRGEEERKACGGSFLVRVSTDHPSIHPSERIHRAVSDATGTRPRPYGPRPVGWSVDRALRWVIEATKVLPGPAGREANSPASYDRP